MERFSRLPRMWRATFRRECIFIIPSHFNHEVIISSSSSSLPAQPSAPGPGGGPSLEATAFPGGWARPASRSASRAEGELR